MGKMNLLVITCGAILMIAPSAFGQQSNCANPQSQTEMNICAGEALRAADGDLNADYKLARDEMRRIDKDLPEDLRGAEKALLNGQRAWIKYRDGACNAEGFVFRGGSIEPLIISTCKERLTRQRSEDLRKLFERN